MRLQCQYALEFMWKESSYLEFRNRNLTQFSHIVAIPTAHAMSASFVSNATWCKIYRPAGGSPWFRTESKLQISYMHPRIEGSVYTKDQLQCCDKLCGDTSDSVLIANNGVAWNGLQPKSRVNLLFSTRIELLAWQC